MDLQKTYRRWLERADDSLEDELHSLDSDEDIFKDAFYKDLAFGTGGLRGIIGAGSNRMNIHTVAKATQGLANYLNASFEYPSVAIARDSRHMGMEFCKVAACVLAANGIKTNLYPRIEPTPALSFAVRYLKCSAGICITASHNPASYNGYKVYGADGCQITTDAAKQIQESIDAVDIFDDVLKMDFEDAVNREMVAWIEDDTIDRYLDACESASSESDTLGLKVVYTPLHGAGLECVKKILKRIGVDDIVIEPEQSVPDGDFPTCPYPNPEVKEALERGLALARKEDADLLVATDPDADRVGVAVIEEGTSVLLTGNELGILLLDYICEALNKRGEDLHEKVVITTVVSSAMADALAADRGFELRRTLTGFKYIGEQIGLLEQAGQMGRFALGFEESYGYLVGTHVRDKDAVVSSMLICEMASWYKARGKNLVEALEELYRRYGYYKNRLISIEYPGASGAEIMREILHKLRTNAPAQVEGLQVIGLVDYAEGVVMPVVGGKGNYTQQVLPSSNVLEFRLENECKLIVRPSGTEPKIKGYIFAKGASESQAELILNDLEQGFRKLVCV